MNGQQVQHSQLTNCRVSTQKRSMDKNCFNSEFVSSLPETFTSSLRQLYSILDKTNSGYVSFDVFKRYFDGSSSTLDFLRELEIESKSNNYFITFNLLINVIERSLSTVKRPPSVLIPKSTCPSISHSLNRSTDVLVATPKSKQIEREIPIMYRSLNGFERNSYSKTNPVYYTKESFRNNEMNLSTIQYLKQFQCERDLLIQTCDTLDHVKLYLTDCLLNMNNKQKSYCRYLTTAETMGLNPESMYNRDLIADLFKLAHTVVEDVNYDFKKSSFNGSNNRYQKQLKEKDDYIKLLETEKRVLLKELIEMKHQHKTMIPIQIS